MAISDSTLIEWLTHPLVGVRSASLELLSSSFSTDQRWLPQIFAAWDQFGPEHAFPEFPLLSHYWIPKEWVGDCIERAKQMAVGRELTNKVCRCAGKLIEAISVASPITFQDHVAAIADLKKQSKIFFRINDQKMQARCQSIDLEFDDLAETLLSNPGSVANLYEVLESQFLQGKADEVLKLGFNHFSAEVSDANLTQVSNVCLELATRYRMIGYEATLLDLTDHRNAMIADAAAIGLARCRTDTTLSLVADRFADYSRAGQLRLVDVLRRGRLPKTAELLRFLHGPAQGAPVQNALRIGELLQFDLSSIEDWLEALVVVDESSLQQWKGLFAIVGLWSESLAPDDRRRTLALLQTRIPQPEVNA